MPRRLRSGEAQQELDWTERLRWNDLPSDVRDEIRRHLRQLLVEAVARTGRGAEGRRDE